MFNHKYLYKILLALVLSVCTKGYAQFDNKTPALLPSSNSLSIIKYSNTPVNLYSGVPHISAELHNLKGRHLSIPIILNYNASGVKVQEVAGTVGLGWSMNVNSMITRVVRGLPDENPTAGYFNGVLGGDMKTLTKTNVEKVIKSELDTEPDIYYVNINGVSMKFVFDINKNPVYLNNNDIKIINSPFKKELNQDGWILKDLLGNKYYFGDNSNYIETSQVTQFAEPTLPPLPIKTFVSTWFLSKITTANDLENVFYDYISGPAVKSTAYIKNHKYIKKTTITTIYEPAILWGLIRKAKYYSFPTISYEGQSSWNGNIETNIINPKYLRLISTSSNEQVWFSYNVSSANRLDLPGGKFLENIEVKKGNNETSKFFTLNFTYQNSYVSGGLNEPEALRLSLDNIQLSDKNFSNPRRLFAFTYNPLKLPLRSSPKTDHWGYYSKYGANFYTPENPGETFKESDPSLMLAGSLSKITYETGGFKEFFYECNRYYNITAKKERLAGGLRIQSIKSFVGINDIKPEITSYSYKEVDGTKTSSGKLLVLENSYVSFIDHENSNRQALILLLVLL